MRRGEETEQKTYTEGVRDEGMRETARASDTDGRK